MISPLSAMKSLLLLRCNVRNGRETTSRLPQMKLLGDSDWFVDICSWIWASVAENWPHLTITRKSWLTAFTFETLHNSVSYFFILQLECMLVAMFWWIKVEQNLIHAGKSSVIQQEGTHSVCLTSVYLLYPRLSHDNAETCLIERLGQF